MPYSNSSVGIFQIAGSAMAAQSQRMNTTASNLANAQSATGTEAATYHARKPVFAAITQGGGSSVQVLDVVESTEPLRKSYEPDHPLADAEGYVRRPDIDMSSQMTQLIMAQRGYQANAAIVDRAKESYQAALQIGRS